MRKQEIKIEGCLYCKFETIVINPTEFKKTATAPYCNYYRRYIPSTPKVNKPDFCKIANIIIEEEE